MNYRYHEVKLDKGMYAETGRSFAQVLEEQDPSENYKGTPPGGPGRLPAAAQAL